MNYFFRRIAGVTLLFLTALSCQPDETVCSKEVPADRLALVDPARLATDIVTIDNYLAQNNISAQTESNGLRYYVAQVGTGDTPCLESYVTVKYTGRLLSNGVIFDSSANPVQFQLDNLIMGWQLGFLQLSKGAVATLFVPSGYGYGVTGAPPSIPANANLIFSVELIDIR